MIHKTEVPLRFIVSSRGTAICETTKELARILRPLVAQSPYHVQNTMDFMQKIKNIKLEKDECISLYDVKHFYISAHRTSHQDYQRKDETGQGSFFENNHDHGHHHQPTGFYLRNTYFLLQGNSEHLRCSQFIKVNIFIRPEEAMLATWQKLVYHKIKFLFLEKHTTYTTSKMCLKLGSNVYLQYYTNTRHVLCIY